MAAVLGHLIIETAGIEEELAEALDTVLRVEIEEEGEINGEGKVGGEETQGELGAIEFLTQEAEPTGTTLVDSRNGFNELSRLAMLWTVHHCWPAGTRFMFNCYRQWAQLVLRQPRELPVTILSREGVTQEDSLLMLLYRTTPITLAEELREADLILLSPFHADDAAFEISEQQNAHPIKMLTKRGPDQGYFSQPDKYLFISDTPGQEEAAKRELAAEGL